MAAENTENFENVSGVHSDSEESQNDEEEAPVSQKSSSRLSNYENNAMKNPFKIPNDNDIFLIRDRERQKKKQERLRQKTLKVHEKTTAAAKLSFREAALIRGPSVDEEELASKNGIMAVKQDPGFTIAVTKDRQVEKDSLTEYITKKREMFLLQYSIGVKREEMRKLEEMATAEEKKLELAEQYLEEDAAMFDEFLKENDKNSVEAIKIAEEEAKLKLGKVTEIKKLNASMMQIKSEINKYQEQLGEYKNYKQFLERLIPDEIQKDREAAAQRRKEERRQKREEEAKQNAAASETGSKSGGKGKSQSNRKSGTKTSTEDSAKSLVLDELSSDDEEDDLYFSDPQQLLDIFTELEESNLSLIQNCQETEEGLEEMKQLIESTKKKKDHETNNLLDQIEKLNKMIELEAEKERELDLKAKMFSYGEYEAKDQEQILSDLNKKVEEVYRSCIADSEASLTTLQMLTNIENRIEELFQTMELLPQDRVEAAQKAKERERRLKMREEKKLQQKLHQEERVKKALERAKAAPKKQTGRRVMTRSEPPQLKKKDDGLSEKQSREEEELAYFFT